MGIGDWGFVLGVFHNQIPFVQDERRDDIWKPVPCKGELLLFSNKFIK